MKAIVLAVLLFVAGCSALPSAVDPQTWNAAIAAELAVLEVEPATVVPPGPAPAPTTHARADCPTGGWITHGDGHKTRCPNCDPPWASSEPAQTDIQTPAPRPHLTPTQPVTTHRSGSCASGSCGPAASSGGGGGYSAPSFRRFGRRR